MAQTFTFQEYGATIQGAIDLASAPPCPPPITSLRMLKYYAAHIIRLNFVSPMEIPYFNSHAVQILLTEELPRLRELRIWLQPPHAPSDGVPVPVVIYPYLQPRLTNLSLIGVPVSTVSLLSTLTELELRDYPANRAQPLDWPTFARLMNTAEALETLVIHSYLWSMTGNPYDVRLIHLPALRKFALEEAPHTTGHVINWMGQQIPRNTIIVGLHTSVSLKYPINRPDREEHEGLFINLIGKNRIHTGSHPSPPNIFSEVTGAKLVFSDTSIALVCTGGSKQNPLRLVIKLACNELPKFDRDLRTKLHTAVLQSVKWVLGDTYRAMRTMEVIGVSDHVLASAWVALCSTLHVSLYALQEFTLTQDPTGIESDGYAAVELFKAICGQSEHKSAYPRPLFPDGLKVLYIRGLRCSRFLVESLKTLSQHRVVKHLKLELFCLTMEDGRYLQQVEMLVRQNSGWTITTLESKKPLIVYV